MNTKLLNNLTYTYLSIPTIIFLIGWCKPIISIPITILILLSIIYRIKNNKINILKEIKDNKKTIIITLIISLIIIYLSGIGGYTFQNEDHLYRNAIFEELVNNNWPIYHNEIGNYNKSIIFTYYFASWLPASIIAKITNISIGYLFLYLWNVTGLFIVLNYIKTYSKDKGYSVILLFLLFSGLDILSEIYNGNNPFKIILNSTHIEWGTTFQMSSFITQLFWVYNQAIPAWLITLFILKEKDNKYIGTIIAMSLLFCTFPTAGLLFILIYKVFIENKSNIKEWSKNTFTWQNILIGLPLLIIYYLFIGTNNSSQSIKIGIDSYRIYQLITTYLLEFGLYFILCYKYIKNKKLYWCTLLSLLICPLIKIGTSEDFCMRACIPSQLIMFTFIIETLNKTNKPKIIQYTLIILICLGSITPINEITRTIKNINNKTTEKIDLKTDVKSDNFYGYKEDNLFVKYIAKHK